MVEQNGYTSPRNVYSTLRHSSAQGTLRRAQTNNSTGCLACLIVPLMPAWLAGLPEGASSTKMPSSPSCRTVWGGAIVMPRTGRMTLPNLRICSTKPLTESTGMAKPTPDDEPLPIEHHNIMLNGVMVVCNLNGPTYGLHQGLTQPLHCQQHAAMTEAHAQCCVLPYSPSALHAIAS